MSYRFVFIMKPARKGELIIGTLALESGREPEGIDLVDLWPVTSGCRWNQATESCWTRNRGLLPPSNAIQGEYSIGTEIGHSTNLKAVGEHLFTIWPLTVWDLGGNYKRQGLAVHFDANHATSPGSGGCIVLTDLAEWESFMGQMKELCDSGIKEVPLTVEYETGGENV